MIKHETIDKIFREARIEDVVGEFVTLKKRGVNLLGLCPFHNEKSPSFTVTAAKGIFKCFGCGKGGNAVTFIMEHENYSYPEALKWLAQKYHIEIEEDFDKTIEESKAENKERESLLIALQWAADYFTDNLLNKEEGQNIGLSYFEERGFRKDTIKKFALGYCMDAWHDFADNAIKSGYLPAYLEKAGLIKQKENSQEYFDFFKGRVMFPIQNLAGKVVGFGGRVLQKDAKTAKYLNSPESEVYHKSDVLYGVYQAKKSISQLDNCYLVEGYTDVITLHQSGIENVVASSGTSLTDGQIKLIKRFTENVTVLYDGDSAGIKASLRGIDLLLAGGLNVKVVKFPDGEDPDSYCKKIGDEEFKEYLQKERKDFITFKSKLLLEGNEGDPIARAEVMRNVAASVAKIPDHLKREVYIQECEKTFGFAAEMFAKEIAQVRRNEKIKTDDQQEYAAKPAFTNVQVPLISDKPITDEYIEKDLIRVMVEFGNLPFNDTETVNEYIFRDLKDSEITFELKNIEKCFEYIVTIDAENIEKLLIKHPDPEINSLAVDILNAAPIISPHWNSRYEVDIKPREKSYKQDTIKVINLLKIRKVDKILSVLQKDLKSSTTDEEVQNNQMLIMHYKKVIKELCDFSGTVVIK